MALIPSWEAVAFLRLSANKQSSPASDVVSGAFPQLCIPHTHWIGEFTRFFGLALYCCSKISSAGCSQGAGLETFLALINSCNSYAPKSISGPFLINGCPSLKLPRGRRRKNILIKQLRFSIVQDVIGKCNVRQWLKRRKTTPGCAHSELSSICCSGMRIGVKSHR